MRYLEPRQPLIRQRYCTFCLHEAILRAVGDEREESKMLVIINEKWGGGLRAIQDGGYIAPSGGPGFGPRCPVTIGPCVCFEYNLSLCSNHLAELVGKLIARMPE